MKWIKAVLGVMIIVILIASLLGLVFIKIRYGRDWFAPYQIFFIPFFFLFIFLLGIASKLLEEREQEQRKREMEIYERKHRSDKKPVSDFEELIPDDHGEIGVYNRRTGKHYLKNPDGSLREQ